MGIYDREWYREPDKSPYGDNQKISRAEAERLRRMMENNPNEPPKVDPKYRYEATKKPLRSDEDIEKEVDAFISATERMREKKYEIPSNKKDDNGDE